MRPNAKPFRTRWLLAAAIGCCTSTAMCMSLDGCSRTVNRAAERRIRDTLPQYIGPAAHWTAHIDNSPRRTLAGHISHVEVTGFGVVMQGGLEADKLRINLTDLTVNVAARRLESVGSADFTAELSESSVNRYLKSFTPPDPGPVKLRVVRFHRAAVWVYGSRTVIHHDWPFAAALSPAVAPPSSIRFTARRLTVLGHWVPLPASALDYLSHRLGTVLNLSTLPFRLKLTGVDVQPGKIMITGEAGVVPSVNQQMPAAWKP